jgi:hypothetical protein
VPHLSCTQYANGSISLVSLARKLKQQGRAVDLAARAQEHQAMLSALTRQPVRLLAL